MSLSPLLNKNGNPLRGQKYKISDCFPKKIYFDEKRCYSPVIGYHFRFAACKPSLRGTRLPRRDGVCEGPVSTLYSGQ
jgi:hypothetical protein